MKGSSHKNNRAKSRRAFLRTIPAAAVVGLSIPSAAQNEPRSQIGKETLKCAESMDGVFFTDAEEDQILPNANHFYEDYEKLRNVTMTLDMEPAFSFRPVISMPRRGDGATPNKPLVLATPLHKADQSAAGNLPFLPITALAVLLKQRKISSTELTKAYLGRLKRYDSVLECVITLTEELALSQAAKADREIQAGEYRGPLHGIPWGVKDLFATKGIRTTWGAKTFENQIIDEDATTIERLREAGAVLLAKLTTGELAGNDLWFGGKTKNPWNPKLGSGGSSAGPASATAAGLVGFSVGTDTGGSIIQPADTCGVVGLRPTYGRVSRHGVMPLRWTMDKVGPICRSVEDCALVLNAIYGPDGRDPTVADVPFAWNPKAPLSSLRIGFVEAEFNAPPPNLNPEAQNQWPLRKKLLADALETFRREGAQLEPIALPEFPVEATWRILSAESGAVFDAFVRSGAANDLRGKGLNERANQLRTSRFIPAIEYIQAQRMRLLLSREMEMLFAKFDAFLAPPDSRSLLMTSMTGHPAVVLKAGFASQMPQGILITGGLYDEGTVLRVALAYERATKWHYMHPHV